MEALMVRRPDALEKAMTEYRNEFQAEEEELREFLREMVGGEGID